MAEYIVDTTDGILDARTTGEMRGMQALRDGR